MFLNAPITHPRVFNRLMEIILRKGAVVEYEIMKTIIPKEG
jgi:hypothetical protein